MAATEFPKVGGYQPVRSVGRGGMGEVWEAIELKTGKRVALKLLSRTEASTHAASDVTFLNEARLGARLVHKNLVAVSDVGVDGATLYFAMELLEGRPLSSLVGRGAPRWPVPLVVEVARQGLEGLSAVHHHIAPDGSAAHIVHRDIKPSNLFLTDAGVVKIIDFGIARGLDSERTRTRTGVFRGSLPYASPEQARGEELDERSDLFSFAAVLFELLTGRRLFNQDNDAAVVLAIVNQPAPLVTSLRAEVPDTFAAWLAHGLERDKERRPANAQGWLAALDAASAGLPRWTEADAAQWLRSVPREVSSVGTAALADEPVPLPAPLPVPASRPKSHAKALAAFATALIVAVGAWWGMSNQRPEPKPIPVPGVESPPPVPVPETVPEPRAEPEVVANAPEPVKKSPKARGGWVTVDVSPGYGKVRLDGADLGLTPLYRAPASAGRHTVEVEREDGRVTKRTVTVASEKEAVVRLRW